MEHRLFIQDDRKVDRIKAGGLSAPSKKIKSNHVPLALEKAKAGAKEPCSSTYGLHIKTQAYHTVGLHRCGDPGNFVWRADLSQLV
jgi:hypothetical protein